MTRFTSYGTCQLCGKRTSKAGMTRHLKSCPAAHDLPRGRAARLFHLRVEDAYSPIFWLDLEIKAGATLEDLDSFLRGIWLECCDHLSSFEIEGVTYTLLPYGEPLYGGSLFDFDDRSMDAKLWRVLSPGTRFEHTYDFGTSTDLKLRVVGDREGRIGDEPLRVLSRNEVPEWTCMVCEGPATEICTSCMYGRENPCLCDAHAEEHDCGEDALLPLVNSPRVGMCGYTG
jgi:hypothetical protein